MTTKILGSAPEPFDGTPRKAEAFWNALESYYYLNEAAYTDESRRVSAALTHFKLGTPAGVWAQDRQNEALARTPKTCGTWADFQAWCKDHFIPTHSAMEATNLMHTLQMGNRSFEEWYQEWATYASRSGANEATKMWAFRKAIPGALNQKLIGLSPQPTTMDDLVKRDRKSVV